MSEPIRTVEERKALAVGANRTQEPEMEIDLMELFFRMIDNIWIIILACVVGTALAGAYTVYFMTPMYSAQSKLYVVNSSNSAISLSDIQLGSTLSTDYVEVFKNWHVHELVKERLGLDYSYEQLGGMVSVSSVGTTRVLSITARSSDPYEAQLLANTYAEVGREFIAVKMDVREPNVFEEALLPTYPYSPNRAANMLLGFMGGFVLSAGIITLIFLLDDRIRSSKDVERVTGLPVLGMMPEIDPKRANKNAKRYERYGRKASGK